MLDSTPPPRPVRLVTAPSPEALESARRVLRAALTWQAGGLVMIGRLAPADACAWVRRRLARLPRVVAGEATDPETAATVAEALRHAGASVVER